MASSRSQAPSSKMVCSAPVLSQGPAPYSTETTGFRVQGACPTVKSLQLCLTFLLHLGLCLPASFPCHWLSSSRLLSLWVNA